MQTTLPEFPTITKDWIEALSAWAAFHIVVATFVITLFGMILGAFVLLLSVRQYAVAKRAEADLTLTKNKQEKFKNVFKLLTMIGAHDRTAGSFAELAAIEELRHYPEYHSVYVYMLARYKSFDKSLDMDEYITATERLIERTRLRPQ